MQAAVAANGRVTVKLALFGREPSRKKNIERDTADRRMPPPWNVSNLYTNTSRAIIHLMHRCHFSEEQKNERRVLRVCECVCVFLCVLGVNETEKIAVLFVSGHMYIARAQAPCTSLKWRWDIEKEGMQNKQLRTTCLTFFLSFHFLLFPNTRLIHDCHALYTRA